MSDFIDMCHVMAWSNSNNEVRLQNLMFIQAVAKHLAKIHLDAEGIFQANLKERAKRFLAESKIEPHILNLEESMSYEEDEFLINQEKLENDSDPNKDGG